MHACAHTNSDEISATAGIGVCPVKWRDSRISAARAGKNFYGPWDKNRLVPWKSSRNKSLPSLTAPNSHYQNATSAECCISVGIDTSIRSRYLSPRTSLSIAVLWNVIYFFACHYLSS